MKPFALTDINPRYHEQIINALAPRVSHTLPESNAGKNTLGARKDEKGGATRFRVRITRRGTKLLDLDNLYGSVKYVCDSLRYKKLIPEDNPEAIELEVRQEKVKRPQTGTLIEITPL